MNDDKVQQLQEELERQKSALEKLRAEHATLVQTLNSVLNMFRFTLGIAYHAHPDNDNIKAMVDNLYSTKEESK